MRAMLENCSGRMNVTMVAVMAMSKKDRNDDRLADANNAPVIKKMKTGFLMRLLIFVWFHMRRKTMGVGY